MAVVLAGCSSQVAEDLSVETLGKSGKAVITMAATFDGDLERNCTEVGFEPQDRATRTPLYVQHPDGQRSFRTRLKLGTGFVVDGHNEIVGSMEIEPGRYKVAAVTCPGIRSSTKPAQVISPNPEGFGTFEVAAGEVVNLGKVVLFEVPTERLVIVSHVAPLKTDPRTRLNKDLALRLVDRPLTPGHRPLPKAELARICEQRRANPPLIIGPKSPPVVCTLAGL